MGRIRRQYYERAVYHVYNRGNDGLEIFFDDEDKKILIEVVARYKERFNFRIYAVVLMDNHYHMVVESNPTHNISKIMQAIQLAYGSQYRKKYKFIGHLWQSRFQSKIFLGERYILECLDYIHENPVKAGLVMRAQDYRWSSSGIYEGTLVGKLEEVLAIDRYGDTSVVNY